MRTTLRAAPPLRVDRGDVLADPGGAGVAAHAGRHRRAVARGVAEDVGPQDVAGVVVGGAGERAARVQAPEPVARADPVDELDDLALGAVEPGVLGLRGAGLPGQPAQQQITAPQASSAVRIRKPPMVHPCRRDPGSPPEIPSLAAPPRCCDLSRRGTLRESDGCRAVSQLAAHSAGCCDPRHRSALRLDAAGAAPRARAARPPAAPLRPAGGAAARARARGADPHRALAVDQRPQPRRRLPAAARALPGLGGGARRAARRGRGGDPARRPAPPEVGADPGDPARAAGPARPELPRRAAGGRGARRT